MSQPPRHQRSQVRSQPVETAADGRRTRRAPGQIQALIIEAARASFAEKGYARTTTKEIAERAEVAESLLFRNFGSKANLFGEAVLLPIADVIRQWIDITGPPTEAAAEVMENQYIAQMFDTISQNRRLLLSFLTAGAFEPEVVKGLGPGRQIQQAIDDLVAVSEKRLSDLGVDASEINVPIASRAVLGMLLATALFEDWLMPGGARRPKRQAIVEELGRMVLYGSLTRPPADNKGGRVGRRAASAKPIARKRP